MVGAITRQALVSRSAPMPILRRPMVSRTAFDCMSSCPDVAAIMRFASEYDKPRPGPLSETFVAPPLPLSALRCGLVGVTVARSIWICDRGRRRFEDAWCHGRAFPASRWAGSKQAIGDRSITAVFVGDRLASRKKAQDRQALAGVVAAGGWLKSL